jgi:hypothetical protein
MATSPWSDLSVVRGSQDVYNSKVFKEMCTHLATYAFAPREVNLNGKRFAVELVFGYDDLVSVRLWELKPEGKSFDFPSSGLRCRFWFNLSLAKEAIATRGTYPLFIPGIVSFIELLRPISMYSRYMRFWFKYQDLPNSNSVLMGDLRFTSADLACTIVSDKGSQEFASGILKVVPSFMVKLDRGYM